MRDINWLTDSYRDFLKGRMDELKSKGEELRKSGSEDEAILEKIKFNVADIFSKMFNLSKGDTKEEIKEKYFAYLHKITSPWRNNREKAIEFNEDKDSLIESIKLDEAEELKKHFEIFYEQL